MPRTLFVNPFTNPRRRKRKRKAAKRSHRRKAKGYRLLRKRVYTRNAGISPFVQNPLILSNPRRRHRRRNPSARAGLSLNKLLNSLLTGAAGAGTALTVNTVALNKIANPWFRRGAQAGAAVVGGALIASKSPAMGGAYTGAQLYPLVQDLAADLLGIGGAAVAATEADIDALAADLEDVMDEMDEGGFGEDDEDVW